MLHVVSYQASDLLEIKISRDNLEKQIIKYKYFTRSISTLFPSNFCYKTGWNQKIKPKIRFF